jgi:hypothetical protein
VSGPDPCREALGRCQETDGNVNQPGSSPLLELEIPGKPPRTSGCTVCSDHGNNLTSKWIGLFRWACERYRSIFAPK